MGILKILGECWALGKRTYQEVGIIAREVLSLVAETQQDAVLPVPIATMGSSQAISLPNTLDFCDLYDFNFDEALRSMPPIPLYGYEMGS